jgi:hypothetical protein
MRGERQTEGQESYNRIIFSWMDGSLRSFNQVSFSLFRLL